MICLVGGGGLCLVGGLGLRGSLGSGRACDLRPPPSLPPTCARVVAGMGRGGAGRSGARCVEVHKPNPQRARPPLYYACARHTQVPTHLCRNVPPSLSRNRRRCARRRRRTWARALVGAGAAGAAHVRARGAARDSRGVADTVRRREEARRGAGRRARQSPEPAGWI